MNNYDLIIIGAGCGGLTAAASAAKQGKKVLLLEKNDFPGGFAASFVRGRFEFDPTLFLLTGFGTNEEISDTRSVLTELGIADQLPTVPVPSAFRLISEASDGSAIDAVLPFGDESFAEAIGSFGEKEQALKLLHAGHESIEAENALCRTDGSHDRRAVKKMIKDYGNFVRTAPYTLDDVLNVIGLTGKARDICTALWPFLGASTKELSFTDYASFLYTYIEGGAVVPTRRGSDLCMALAGCTEDHGGEIRCGCVVTRILCEDGKAVGVMLKDGETLHAEKIICAISPEAAYSELLKPTEVPAEAKKRTNARTLGLRGASVMIGLNRSAEELGIHDYCTLIYETSDSEKQFDLLKRIDTNNALGAFCPNVAFSAASPKGTAILTLSTLYADNCWADVSPENYFIQKDLLAARLIANYEKATGLVIHNAIEELEVATPLTFARYTGAPQGVAFGYKPVSWDGLFSRFLSENEENEIENLLFCGSYGTLLAGVGPSIVSGRNSAFAAMSTETEVAE